MTPEELSAIEARANAATDGWEIRSLDWTDRDGTVQLNYFKYLNNGTPQIEGPIYCPAYGVWGVETLGNYECGAMELPNAEFVFHSRTDVPALVDHVRELEAQLTAEREACARIVEDTVFQLAPGNTIRCDFRWAELIRARNAALSSEVKP